MTAVQHQWSALATKVYSVRPVERCGCRLEKMRTEAPEFEALLYGVQRQLAGSLPPVQRAELEYTCRRLVVAYLVALGDELEGAMAKWAAQPDELSSARLDDAIDAAFSAVSGRAAASHESFVELASKLEAQHHEVGTMAAALAGLTVRAQTARQLRFDLLGVPNGGLSIEERVSALEPLAENRSLTLESQLEAALVAQHVGAIQLASDLFENVSKELGAIELKLVLSPASVTFEEAGLAARVDRLKPVFEATSLQAALFELEQVAARGLDAPDRQMARAKRVIALARSNTVLRQRAARLLREAHHTALSRQVGGPAVKSPLRSSAVLVSRPASAWLEGAAPPAVQRPQR